VKPTDQNVVPTLRMSRGTSPLPPYVFVACTQRTSFYYVYVTNLAGYLNENVIEYKSM
jgi:hypothetical protein